MADCKNPECGHQFFDESGKALEPNGWKDKFTAYYICPKCHKKSFFTTSEEYDSTIFNYGCLEE